MVRFIEQYGIYRVDFVFLKIVLYSFFICNVIYFKFNMRIYELYLNIFKILYYYFMNLEYFYVQLV